MNPPDADTAFYPGLEQYLKACAAESTMIPEERRQALKRVSTYVRERLNDGNPARLTFICTHNSRRSQMAQIWAQAAAKFFGVPGVSAFSGGTETTAFNPRAVAALSRAGFQVERTTTGENPVYHVHAGYELDPVRAFSKTYLDHSNPQRGFCAVMTCSSADRDCSVISTADERVLIACEDPKHYDGTDQETAQYDERCRQICREMCWVFAATVSL